LFKDVGTKKKEVGNSETPLVRQDQDQASDIIDVAVPEGTKDCQRHAEAQSAIQLSIREDQRHVPADVDYMYSITHPPVNKVGDSSRVDS
jgi:hypothetical protein